MNIPDRGDNYDGTLNDPPEGREQDAAFIVRACNSHAALVEALEWYVTEYAIPEKDRGLGIDHLFAGEAKARAALSIAKEGGQ